MNENQLNELLENPKEVEDRIAFYKKNNILLTQEVVETEIEGHIQKAEHNISFVQYTKQGFSDWAIVGCYYASYHTAMALLIKKGFSSKNHDATLCILIEYYFKKGLSKEDITLFNEVYLDNNDILFYVQSKQEREKASYSSQIIFDKKIVNELIMKTLLFVSKGKEILTR